MLCIHYTNPDMKYIDEAQQVKIDGDRLNDETLEKFINMKPDRHVYIDTTEVDLFKTVEYMRKLQELKQYNNWTLQVPLKTIFKTAEDTAPEIDETKLAALRDCSSHLMFTDLIGQWEILQFVLSLKPSEVYITNILGFDLERLKKVCGNIGIRAYANWAQSAWEGIEPLRKFFIRPEDAAEYMNNYLSGIEFQGNANIQEIMYEVYTKGYWYGNLDEIIIDFNGNIDSRRLPREFGHYRLECGKRCITGSNCNLCRAMRGFVERMEKTDTIIKPISKD